MICRLYGYANLTTTVAVLWLDWTFGSFCVLQVSCSPYEVFLGSWPTLLASLHIAPVPCKVRMFFSATSMRAMISTALAMWGLGVELSEFLVVSTLHQTKTLNLQVLDCSSGTWTFYQWQMAMAHIGASTCPLLFKCLVPQSFWSNGVPKHGMSLCQWCQGVWLCVSLSWFIGPCTLSTYLNWTPKAVQWGRLPYWQVCRLHLRRQM